MLYAPNLRHCLLTVAALLIFPLTTSGQFTGITLPPANGRVIPEFATTLGDALEIYFASEDDLDGSFGTLDRGFGTYVAPRAAPESPSSIYFNPEQLGNAPRAAPVRRGKSLLNRGPFLLAFSMADAFRESTLARPAPDGDRTDGHTRVRLP